MSDFAARRINMVEGQIRPNKVTDAALVAALSTVPREEFVPEPLRSVAYVDEEIRLPGGRRLVEPMVLARLLDSARIRPADRVLDVGPATGYSTAVLAALAGSVTGLECDPALAAQAAATLARLGITNAGVETGPLTEGWRVKAPFSVIVINGAVAAPPATLLEQLCEGGRAVGVLRGSGGLGRATLWRRVGGVVSGVALFDAAAILLPGFEPAPAFQF
jgi:protein-L-isoaspartate(D-aspartate) O-methyltransferase